MTEWFGINYPFSGGIQNVFSKQIGVRLIKNDVLQLIFTNPGERVYRPDYGIGIRTYLFEQLDDASVFELEAKIRDQISIHERRINLDQLDVEQDRDKNRLRVLIIASLTQSPDEIFEINLNLPIFEET